MSHEYQIVGHFPDYPHSWPVLVKIEDSLCYWETFDSHTAIPTSLIPVHVELLQLMQVKHHVLYHTSSSIH